MTPADGTHTDHELGPKPRGPNGRLDVLFVEDSPEDAELMTRALREAGYQIRSKRVASAQALRDALNAGTWDVVITDHYMPGFCGTRAREIVRKHDSELPLIVVSGELPDDLAADAMWAGARDFVHKDFLSRLAPVVDREVREAAVRRRSRLAQTRAEIASEALEIHERVLSEMPLGVVVCATSEAPPQTFPVLWVNPAAHQVLRRPEEMLGHTLGDVLPELLESEVLGLVRRAAAEGASGVVPAFKLEIDGEQRVLEIRVSRVAPRMVAAYIHDISERFLLESQMRAAQRMETVGRLAGGVAHDFNNIMTVVESYSGFLLDQLGDDDPMREDLTVISDAALRASRLTSQLLAFSRRQPQQLEHFSINTALSDLDRMLQRAVGESIQLVACPDPDLANVRADRTQLDQVIMNLVVNACDAMPEGGRLTIETKNVELDQEYCDSHGAFIPVGQYVMLAVSDTGTGIDESTLEHIFEPFYTTKPAGKGTGLGLSTVYGIVKQSGGYIWPYTEVGRGTCFKIYFPATEGTEETERVRGGAPPRGGTETILVAEDEEMVRRAAVRVLERAGYTTLEASDGADAVRIALAHEGHIDLLLTDIMMPVLNGRGAAARLVKQRPGLKVVYMSGYTDNTIDVHGTLEHGTYLVHKPFSGGGLLHKVRAALDSPAPGPNLGVQDRRVLVVDDDPPVLNAMRRLLEDEGYSVCACESLDEALHRLEAGERFLAILCDLHVGHRSGLEVHSWLVDNAPGWADRFLLVTGGTTSSDATEFVRSHPSKVVRKPINLAELESRLGTLNTLTEVA